MCWSCTRHFDDSKFLTSLVEIEKRTFEISQRRREVERRDKEEN